MPPGQDNCLHGSGRGALRQGGQESQAQSAPLHLRQERLSLGKGGRERRGWWHGQGEAAALGKGVAPLVAGEEGWPCMRGGAGGRGRCTRVKRGRLLVAL